MHTSTNGENQSAADKQKRGFEEDEDEDEGRRTKDEERRTKKTVQSQ
jgi:hypothetical protein